ncbi:hypothetical protein BDV06DRAFT_32477 [Aspergillus oleicola]
MSTPPVHPTLQKAYDEIIHLHSQEDNLLHLSDAKALGIKLVSLETPLAPTHSTRLLPSKPCFFLPARPEKRASRLAERLRTRPKTLSNQSWSRSRNRSQRATTTTTTTTRRRRARTIAQVQRTRPMCDPQRPLLHRLSYQLASQAQLPRLADICVAKGFVVLIFSFLLCL